MNEQTLRATHPQGGRRLMSDEALPPPRFARSKVWPLVYTNAIAKGATPKQARRLANVTAEAYKKRPRQINPLED